MTYTTIPEMFLQSIETYGDKDAYFEKINNKWINLTYKEVGRQVANFASGLKSLGVKKEDKVAILSHNNPRWAMSDYAIAGLGATSVTVYPTLIAHQIKYIIEDSDTVFIIAQNQEQTDKILTFFDNNSNLKGIIRMDDVSDPEHNIWSYSEVQTLGEDFIKTSGFSFSESVKLLNESEILTLIYTSGTTGNPKGVMLSHRNLVSNVISAHNAMEINSEDVLLSFLPLSHSFERMTGHYSGFSNGATTYYAESIETVAADMGDVSPTLMVAVPRLYEKIHAKILAKVEKDSALKQKIFWWAIGVGQKASKYLTRNNKPSGLLGFKYKIADKLVYSKLKERVGGRMRFFISGGAPLSKEVGEFFMSAGLPIIEGYGLTETSPVITCNRVELIKFGTVGKAIDGVEVKIASDGEILCRGDNVMMGYYKNNESTKESIDSEGWFHTGDIGEFDEDNYLKITDRKKNILVTSGGKNIAPAPLEIALTGNKYIEQCLVIGDQHEFISALIVPDFETLEEWAQLTGIPWDNKEDLIKDKKVLHLFDEVVKKVMVNFSHFEQIKKFILISNGWTIESGEMTPKLSIKRKVVEKNCSALIDDLYQA